MTKTLFVIAYAVLAAACGDFARVSRLSPVGPTPVSPAPVVPVATIPPPPAPLFREPYTELIVGSTIQEKVDESSNPQCPDFYPDLGCQYFRITPDRDGTLDIELTWVPETQRGQGLDVTHESVRGQIWADRFGGPKAYLRSFVKAGETSQITVWYTRPGLEFSLRTSLQPN